jgi:hypothetical protein
MIERIRIRRKIIRIRNTGERQCLVLYSILQYYGGYWQEDLRAGGIVEANHGDHDDHEDTGRQHHTIFIPLSNLIWTSWGIDNKLQKLLHHIHMELNNCFLIFPSLLILSIKLIKIKLTGFRNGCRMILLMFLLVCGKCSRAGFKSYEGRIFFHCFFSLKV